MTPKIIHRKLVDGEWVQRVIVNPPKTSAASLKKAIRAKRGRKKSIKKQRPRKQNPSSDFYKSHEWALARYAALKKSNGKCELCGRDPDDGVKLQVDHIKPYKKYPELALNPNNHQVLCAACNWGKCGKDETDWRKKAS